MHFQQLSIHLILLMQFLVVMKAQLIIPSQCHFWLTRLPIHQFASIFDPDS